jgi:hypothetical protein
MQSVGAEMEYYGGFGEIGDHGRELQGAAGIALGWAKGIESSLPNDRDEPTLGRAEANKPKN